MERSKLVGEEEEDMGIQKLLLVVTGQHLERVNPVTNIGISLKVAELLVIVLQNWERAWAASMELDRSHDGC